MISTTYFRGKYEKFLTNHIHWIKNNGQPILILMYRKRAQIMCLNRTSSKGGNNRIKYLYITASSQVVVCTRVQPTGPSLVVVGYLHAASPLQQTTLPKSTERKQMKPEEKREAMEIKDEEATKVVVVPSRFRRICVFCGSSHGKKKSYQDAAIELGKELVARNIDLVYGGGSVGLMGLVSQAVYNGGRHVIGVIPKTLMPREISGETVGEVKAVADMHQRKAEMARQSAAFIALPGGYGTLEELLEVIAWAHLGIHDKPVGLLNVDGFYNPLLSFIDKAVEEGFIKPTARHIIVLAPTPKELIEKLEEYSPRHEKVVPKMKWEMEQLSYSQNYEIPRPKEGKMIIEAQRGSGLWM